MFGELFGWTIDTIAGGAGGTDERFVLECLMPAEGDRDRAGGIKGALTMLNDINTCCMGNPDSALCDQICENVESQDAVAPFFRARLN